MVLVLRATAVLLLLAFVGAALPESWMKAVYEWGGLGPWPSGALLVYLARAVPILYGFYGILALYLSFDVRRYLPLIGARPRNYRRLTRRRGRPAAPAGAAGGAPGVAGG